MIPQDWLELNNIVIKELQGDLEREMRPGNDEDNEPNEPDAELVEALKVVLRYYMPYAEYEFYIRTLK